MAATMADTLGEKASRIRNSPPHKATRRDATRVSSMTPTLME